MASMRQSESRHEGAGRAITRRRVGLAGLCGLLAAPAAAETGLPDARQIVCAVMREGRRIGSAVTTFDRQGEDVTVGIAIDIHVRLGFIPMFHYTHHNTEHWRGEQLIGFDATTDDNGKPQFANARWNGSALEVNGSRTAPYTAPARALGTSYWNPRTLTDPLINSQNGSLLKVQLTDAGPSQAVLSNGRTVDATEYRMTGELRMNLWYDAAKSWAGLQYYAHDGSIVSYERT